MDPKLCVLFACVGNSGRSIVAEAFAKRHGGAGALAASGARSPPGTFSRRSSTRCASAASTSRRRGARRGVDRARNVDDARRIRDEIERRVAAQLREHGVEPPA
jgi:protein-tyrosine-phosphatase